MRTRSNTITAAGIAVALLGGLLVFSYGRSVQSKAAPADAVSAYVATADVQAGTAWEDVTGRIEQRPVPKDLVPPSAVSDIDALTGRMAVRAIAAGEVVTASQFGTELASGHALEIPPGHNGVAVSMPVPQGVARYIRDGDLVNVYVTFKGGAGGEDRTETKLLLSRVQVLSHHAASQEPVEQATGAGTSGEVLLTLALTPDDTERLVFAKENGSLWFGLANPSDERPSTPGRRWDSILG